MVQVFNKTSAAIYNMKKFGDISTLSCGDKIKANGSGVLKSVQSPTDPPSASTTPPDLRA